LSFEFGTFDIVSDFELRISSFVSAVRGSLAMSGSGAGSRVSRSKPAKVARSRSGSCAASRNSSLILRAMARLYSLSWCSAPCNAMAKLRRTKRTPVRRQAPRARPASAGCYAPPSFAAHRFGLPSRRALCDPQMSGRSGSLQFLEACRSNAGPGVHH